MCRALIAHLRSDDLHHVERDAAARQVRDQVWTSLCELMEECERDGRDLAASEKRAYDQGEGLLEELSGIIQGTEIDRTGVVPRQQMPRSTATASR